MAEGTTVANAFVQVMPSMEGAGSSIANALTGAVGDAGSKAGGTFGTMFTGKVGTAVKALGGAMVGLMAFDKLADSFGEVESGLNNLKIATGATGDAADALKDVYLDVSKNVVGSFEDIGSAVGELNTRFGLQGDELEAASEQAMKYAKVTGQDATKAIQDVSRMMNNAGIPASEYASTLDKLTVAGQAAGIDVGKLATTVNDNAASFKAMGFSTDEAIAMLASFEKSGVNASAVLTGMKKGIKTFTDAGVPAGEAFGEFVKGVQDGSFTLEDAIETFGSKAGLAMYDAASKGQLDFADMYAAITDGSAGALDSIYNDTLTAGEKFDLLGQKLSAGFFEVMEPIVDAVMPFIDDFVSVVGMGIEAVVGVVTPFAELIGALLGQFREQMAPVWAEVQDNVANVVVPAIQSVTEWVSGQLSPVLDMLSQWVSDHVVPAFSAMGDFIMNTVVPDVKALWEWVDRNLGPVFSFLGDLLFNTVVPALLAVAGFVMDNVVPAVKEAYKWVKENVLPVVDSLVQFFNRHVLPVLKDIADFIFNNVVPALSDLYDWVNDNIVPVFDTFIGVLSTVFGWLGDIIDKIGEAIDWMQSFEQNRVDNYGYDNALDYQYAGFATGGFTAGEGLYVAGERGGEFIWPSYEPYISRYADMLASRMPSAGGGVDIHDNTFVVRNDSDIRRVAVELNTLISRQTAGGIA